MQQWYRPSVIILLFAMLGPVRAEPPATIVLAMAELPGVYSVDTESDPPRLSGSIGELQNVLFDSLSDDFQLHPVAMLVPRLLRELQTHDNVCTGILFRTPERETYLYFSHPYIVIPTPQIALTEHGWNLLGRPDDLSLADLVQHPQLQGLRVADRSYGPYADAQLDAAVNPPIVVTGSSNAMRMLAGGRADFLIEYPVVIANTLGEKTDALRFVTIEHSAPFIDVAIACSRSELGAAFVAAVNERLTTLVNDPHYQALNLEVAPKQMQPGLAQLFQQKI
ncbi:transporter substrate-binding domain-containing protein [Saccharospirillum mangrovi]|uniref:transporter substrate-binding domain-containing protein n=1 Tax=Saccharospirillum mangrovi TaxID=2161747 RepID=UPI000D3A2587|nr:transporter substrate-binding domain-containing protein [Saccharospirillum mangrovi]